MSYVQFVVIFVLSTLILPGADNAVHKIDLTTFQNKRFVDLLSNSDVEFRGYVSANYKTTTTFNVGRTSDTGTGKIGVEVVNPDPGTVSSDSGFPEGTTIGYISEDHLKRINTKLEGDNTDKGRVGVFYVTAVDNSSGESVKISTVISADAALIVPNDYVYTITTSIGESVSLEVKTDLKDLRWSHNGGPSIREWDEEDDVTIENVRKADEGTYECYNNGDHELGTHAIMRLIVRDCTAPKYGTECAETCNVCYNGGICHAETGHCICPPGFQGNQCEESCGDNRWGAMCSIWCVKNGNCNGKSFCVPDPVGCSCMSGFTGKECKEGCDSHTYGADCTQTCHCTSGCSRSEGCINADKCTEGYGGPKCQAYSGECPDGYFGRDLCNFRCHCLGDAPCVKSTGVCSNGRCEEGWAGSDCQQQLPVLHTSPVVEIDGEIATVRWQLWNINVDYGTGPVKEYKVYHGKDGQGLSQSTSTAGSQVIIPDLQIETDYEFAVSCVRIVEGIANEGQKGNVVKNTTGCRVPTDSPTILLINVLGSAIVEIYWTVPPGEEWIDCFAGIKSYVITYNPVSLPDDKTSVEVEDSSARKFLIGSLSPCTKYEFAISVTNIDRQGPDSNKSVASTKGSAPGKVQSLSVTPMSFDSMSVSWKEPSNECGIQYYNVTYFPILLDKCQEPANLQEIHNITKSTSIVINSLQAYSTYSIYVSAWSGDLGGDPEITSTQTGESAPSGPPSKVTSKRDIDQIIFTWKRPSCGSRRGKINEYEYVFGRIGEEKSGFADSTKISFNNLTHGIKYVFKIRAMTSIGTGPYTDPIEITPIDPDKEHRTTIIISSVLMGVIVLLIIIVVICFIQKKDPVLGNGFLKNNGFTAKWRCLHIYLRPGNYQLMQNTDENNSMIGDSISSDDSYQLNSPSGSQASNNRQITMVAIPPFEETKT